MTKVSAETMMMMTMATMAKSNGTALTCIEHLPTSPLASASSSLLTGHSMFSSAGVSASCRGAVTENCQGWVMRLLWRLVSENIVNHHAVAGLQRYMDPIR